MMARLSLLTGAFIGSILRDTYFRTQGFLENHAAPHLHINRYQLVVLALFLNLSSANTDCSNHAIVQSDLKRCELISDGTKVCKIFTTAEFILSALNAATCLWFTDKKDNHIFSLNIKLEDITCHFQTKREYYTFPITAKHLSQIVDAVFIAVKAKLVKMVSVLKRKHLKVYHFQECLPANQAV